MCRFVYFFLQKKSERCNIGEGLSTNQTKLLDGFLYSVVMLLWKYKQAIDDRSIGTQNEYKIGKVYQIGRYLHVVTSGGTYFYWSSGIQLCTVELY